MIWSIYTGAKNSNLLIYTDNTFREVRQPGLGLGKGREVVTMTLLLVRPMIEGDNLADVKDLQTINGKIHLLELLQHYQPTFECDLVSLLQNFYEGLTQLSRFSLQIESRYARWSKQAQICNSFDFYSQLIRAPFGYILPRGEWAINSHKIELSLSFILMKKARCRRRCWDPIAGIIKM